ncbi:MAG: hypothetical protein ACI3W5_03700, partial [Faecousia sp.]
MNGKDLFRGLSDVGSDLIENAEHGQFEKNVNARRLLRRPFLIAAIIALMLLLMGCAVAYMLSIREIHIGQQQTYQDVFAYDPESGQAVAYLGQEAVTEEVLTLAGLKGSRNYQAAQEWFAFQKEFDPDHTILNKLQKDGLVPEFPAEYESYNIYSQEMKEKLDEILEKYNLKPIGSTVPFKTEELTLKALGLKDIAIPGTDAIMELDYAAYQECGNLNMDFHFILPGAADEKDLETRCHIYYMHKDAFTEDVISLGEIETWKEWTYKTASGANVLIFRSPADWRGYIFCDMPNYTVTLRFAFIDEQYTTNITGETVHEQEFMTDRQIERLADAIDFSIEPQLIDGWEEFTNQAAGSGEGIEGYSITLKSVKSDGNKASITLGITAPEGVNLLEHNGYPVALKPGNRWGFFEDISGGSGNVAGGYGVEDDGDGKANTQNVILQYTASSGQMREGEKPFASGKVWNIYWQDLYAVYLDEETNEPEAYLLAEGTWSMDVIFEDVLSEELEFITAPLASRAACGWDMKGNDVYQDTMITAFILRPMSATIVCDLEDVAPDFLTVGERCAYVILVDGSRIPLYGDNAGSGIQNLQPEATIDLNQVVSVLMPDGTEIKVP